MNTNPTVAAPKYDAESMAIWEQGRWWLFVLGNAMAQDAIGPLGDMPPRQHRAVCNAVGTFCRNNVLDVERYEIKRLEITWLEPERACGRVVVIVESGMKNDAGTNAEIFCRTRVMFTIGVRGGQDEVGL